jgi:hypothetical protein
VERYFDDAWTRAGRAETCSWMRGYFACLSFLVGRSFLTLRHTSFVAVLPRRNEKRLRLPNTVFLSAWLEDVIRSRLVWRGSCGVLIHIDISDLSRYPPNSFSVVGSHEIPINPPLLFLVWRGVCGMASHYLLPSLNPRQINPVDSAKGYLVADFIAPSLNG